MRFGRAASPVRSAQWSSEVRDSDNMRIGAGSKLLYCSLPCTLRLWVRWDEGPSTREYRNLATAARRAAELPQLLSALHRRTFAGRWRKLHIVRSACRTIDSRKNRNDGAHGARWSRRRVVRGCAPGHPERARRTRSHGVVIDICERYAAERPFGRAGGDVSPARSSSPRSHSRCRVSTRLSARLRSTAGKPREAARDHGASPRALRPARLLLACHP